MDAGTRRLFVAAIVLIVAMTGGAALLLGRPGDGPRPSTSADVPNPSPTGAAGSVAPNASPGASAAIPESPVTGVVVAVDSRGLDDVRAFTMRTGDGSTYVFDLREMRSTATFPLGHLAEHQATADPVIVSFRVEEGVLVATAVDDA